MKMNFFNFKRTHGAIVVIFIMAVVAIVAWFANSSEKQVQKIRTVMRAHIIPEPFKVTETEAQAQTEQQASNSVLSAKHDSVQSAETCSSCAQKNKQLTLQETDAISVKEAAVDQALDQAISKERPFLSIAGLDNKFVRQIFQQVSSEAGWKNINVSPLGISSMMVMAYEGARGTTAREIRSVLGFPAEDGDLKTQAHKEFSVLLPSLNDSDQISCVNSSWFGNNLVIFPEYKEVLNTIYRSDLYYVDFCNSPDATGKINSWCAQKTKGRIKQIIGQTNCSLRFVLINAIYFKAKWKFPFPKEATTKKDFFIDNGVSVPVDMMNKKDGYAYVETEHFQILELPYEKNRFSMVVFLPKERDSKPVLEQLGTDVDSTLWEEMSAAFSALRREEVIINFPKFEFYNDWEKIVDQLKALGMVSPFGDEANFYGISKEPLYITKILQKTFIKVDEESTEAAAVTAGMMGNGAMPIKEELKEFTADHPFIFMIKDNATNSIVFLGQIVDPTKK